MAKILFLAVVATCFAGLMAAEHAIPKNFDEFMAMTEKAFQDMTKHVGEMIPMGSDKAKEVLETMRANANQMATTLQENIGKLHDQVKDNPELTKMVNSLQEKVNESVEKLKADNPELAANAEKLHERMVSTMNTLIGEVKKVEAEVGKEGGVKDTVESMLKDMVESSKVKYQELEKMIHDQIGHGAH
uniref:Apolipophorin-III n=1 Tax=Lethocerus deyrollei TaxID=506670 RepID=B9A9U2_9HEMI|nr:apolipophorin-III precursor [Lethocerus deyrollei]